MGGLCSDFKLCVDATDIIASRLTPTGERISNVGVSLLAMQSLNHHNSFARRKKTPTLRLAFLLWLEACR
jgi:hypothetical protein